MKTYHPVAESYYIVKESTLFKLMLVVKKKLGEHWTPEGAVVLDKDGDYLQTMVYWERSEEEKQASKMKAEKIWANIASSFPRELLDKIDSEES